MQGTEMEVKWSDPAMKANQGYQDAA